MTTITTFLFFDRDGRDVTGTEDVAGYRFQDFFDRDVREITNSRAPGEIRSLLGRAYRGPDCDGIEVQWSVGEG